MLEVQDKTGKIFLSFRGREKLVLTKFKKNHTKFWYKLINEITHIYPLSNGITRTVSEICSKLTIKTPQILWMVLLWCPYCWFWIRKCSCWEVFPCWSIYFTKIMWMECTKVFSKFLRKYQARIEQNYRASKSFLAIFIDFHN